MWRYLKRVLIGKPLKPLMKGQTHLTKFKALAICFLLTQYRQ